MTLLIVGAASVPLLWATSQPWALFRNYQIARVLGLPMVIVPYDPDGFLFGVLSEPLKHLLRRILPQSARQAFDMTLWGWEWHDKSAAHEGLGLSFVVVTPGLTRLITADPAMASAILTRRRDFVHPEVTTKIMGVLGHNIVAVILVSTASRRRVVAPALNERISSGVWTESIAQASGLADALLSSAPTITSTPPSLDNTTSTDTVPGLRAIAINVLKRIAYGKPMPYILPRESDSTPLPNADMTYVDAISLCTEMLLLAAFVPSAILPLPIMPRSVRRLGVALARLPRLTDDMLEQERHTNSSNLAQEENDDGGSTTAPHTIMTTLVRLSDEPKERDLHAAKTTGDDQVASKAQYLTEDEIGGNLFIFTPAGFDTTANTLGYAVTLFAAYPKWQAWIQAGAACFTATAPWLVVAAGQAPPLLRQPRSLPPHRHPSL
ncbi:cytochrome P450 [Microdochium trichocladiopsis]|uniref:Cytochrome P450 n=1 Tax=Microdochium trichocladiopsis TaxID=1682393 RepID=A0A9P9BFN8_9PEZI|nr:cytochrome P450 [Microdochium trichocladiopsis]KAH7012471.1 cytochrome P450 [Microdochium trichocladiopsis]